MKSSFLSGILGLEFPMKCSIKHLTFYRIHEESNKFSGLGIGLFVSSQIIKQHGGKIWATSNGEQGSTFYFSLPMAGELKSDLN